MINDVVATFDNVNLTTTYSTYLSHVLAISLGLEAETVGPTPTSQEVATGGGFGIEGTSETDEP